MNEKWSFVSKIILTYCKKKMFYWLIIGIYEQKNLEKGFLSFTLSYNHTTINRWPALSLRRKITFFIQQPAIFCIFYVPISNTVLLILRIFCLLLSCLQILCNFFPLWLDSKELHDIEIYAAKPRSFLPTMNSTMKYVFL